MKLKLRKALLVLYCILFPLLTVAQAPQYTNHMGMEFVLIKPGSFTLGKFQPPYPKSIDSFSAQRGYHEQHYKLAEELAKRDAMPGFTVKIEKPFYIGKFEVTQTEWKEVMGSNPSFFQGKKVSDDPGRHPVDNVSWEEAQSFLNKLNVLQKENVYRLPTELEWEYAARAGAEDDIPWSEIRSSAQIGTRTTNTVGQKNPNAWGLYDMLGNVWEWVEDYYNAKIFADPTPPLSGREHVLKGASFVGDVKNATYMTHAAGPGNGWDTGFRIVMEVKY